jgi:hypothetical protein
MVLEKRKYPNGIFTEFCLTPTQHSPWDDGTSDGALGK